MKTKLLALVMTCTIVLSAMPLISADTFAGKPSKLYFGQNANNPAEYSLYSNEQRTINFNTDLGSKWSVTWNVEYGQPQLNLNSFDASYHIQIDTSCIINLTGNNTVTNISVSNGNAVKLVGTGNLKAGADTYSIGDTVYLAKAGTNAYKLYVDPTAKFEYIDGINTNWTVSEEQYQGNNYAVLMLNGALNKNVKFVKTGNYVAVLRLNGADTKLGGFDAGDGILTVQNSSADNKKTTVSGDIKALNIYLLECDKVDFNVENGDVIATGNEMLVGSKTAANKFKLTILNGGINCKKGTVSLVNTDLTIKKNGSNEAAETGINANSIIVDGTKLTIDDVAEGVKLYDPIQGDDDGGVLSLSNGATVSINAKEIGIQGTEGVGGYYNNNVTVEEGCAITVEGESKAVSTVAFSPIPKGLEVKSVDGRAVYFKTNSDAKGTADYYYLGTTTPAKALTLAAVSTKDKPIDTGDSNNLTLYCILALLALAGLGCAYRSKTL